MFCNGVGENIIQKVGANHIEVAWVEVSPRYFTKSLAYGLEARLFRKDTTQAHQYAWVFLVVEPTKRQLLRERLYCSEFDPWVALDEADCLVESWEDNR